MDYTDFANDDFNAKEWINRMFKRELDIQQKSDEFAELLVEKLQLYARELNDKIEEDSKQLLNNLSDVIQESEKLEKKVIQFRGQVDIVQQDVTQIENTSGKSVSNVERIHAVKAGMENAKNSLLEADNWAVMASKIEGSFEGGSIEDFSDKLISMQRSLAALENTEYYDERRLQLEGLKNRMEALAGPQIIHAFTTFDAERSKKIVRIFSSLDRMSQLMNYYKSCVKGNLCHKWKWKIESDEDGNVVQTMRELYKILITTWKSQIEWCADVLENINMVNEICESFVSALKECECSLKSYIEFAVKQSNEPLNLLKELQSTSIKFLEELQMLYHSSNGSLEMWKKMEKAVHSPYILYIEKYHEFETDIFRGELSSIDANCDNIYEVVQSLNPTIENIIRSIKQAVDRCIMFTKGTAIAYLVTAIKAYLRTYIKIYEAVSIKLRTELADRENWPLFRVAMSLIQILGDLLNEIKTLDSFLIENVCNIGNSETTKYYSSIFLSSEGMKEYSSFVNPIVNGKEKTILDEILDVIIFVCNQVHKVAHDIVINPIVKLFATAKLQWNKIKDSSSLELPIYSFSPLEYITKIGEYLITLPQRLETFLSYENHYLIQSLRVCDTQFHSVNSDEKIYANALLAVISVSTCEMYAEKIQSINELNDYSCKQLIADIDYFSNVLEELGLGLSNTLLDISALLKLPSSEYHKKSIGHSAKIVSIIRHMRNISSE